MTQSRRPCDMFTRAGWEEQYAQWLLSIAKSNDLLTQSTRYSGVYPVLSSEYRILASIELCLGNPTAQIRNTLLKSAEYELHLWRLRRETPTVISIGWLSTEDGTSGIGSALTANNLPVAYELAQTMLDVLRLEKSLGKDRSVGVMAHWSFVHILLGNDDEAMDYVERIMRKDTGRDRKLYQPFALMSQGIILQSRELFERAFVEYHDIYDGYARRGRYQNLPHVVLSLHSLGFCKIAKLRNLEHSVESQYAPHRLLEDESV